MEGKETYTEMAMPQTDEISTIALLTTFSKSVGAHEWKNAQNLAQRILEREPKNMIVAEFLPLIERAVNELDDGSNEESDEESNEESDEESGEEKSSSAVSRSTFRKK